VSTPTAADYAVVYPSNWRILAAMEDDASVDAIWRWAAAKDFWWNRIEEEKALARAIARGGLARDIEELGWMVRANCRFMGDSAATNARYAVALIRGWVAVHGDAS
jgi:hypothetical protein